MDGRLLLTEGIDILCYGSFSTSEMSPMNSTLFHFISPRSATYDTHC